MQHKQETVPVQAHVAMVPSPGMGHLIPLVELANRLVLQHNIRVTFIVPDDGSSMKPQKKLLESLPEMISTVFLPPVNFEDLPDNVKMETRIELSMTRSLPAFRDSLKVLVESELTTGRLVALVVDLFGVATFDVAREFGVPPYIFFTSTAMELSFIFLMPELDEKFACEYKDLPEPVKLPGCVPVHGSDLMDPVQDKNDNVYKWVLYLAKHYPSVAGFLVNSFMELEPGAFKALMEGESGFGVPIYPVGPLVQTSSNIVDNVDDHFECLKWLDQQPSGSVLFVSFGSGGTLSQEQLYELAFGLEMSGQKFLWVAKSPHERASNATYFGVQSIDDPFDFLPKGFLGRIKSNEQKMNAVLLTDDLKVALRVKVDENGLVGRDDIAKYARGLIKGGEGKLLRNNMKKLKDAAAIVLSQDGSSTKSLAQVAEIWKNQEKDASACFWLVKSP
ncbi:hypothetical protein QYF36_014283 [Acer negundo]|nr:hypothetical protein QYF36_014283 [Acer negundo]